MSTEDESLNLIVLFTFNRDSVQCNCQDQDDLIFNSLASRKAIPRPVKTNLDIRTIST